VDSVDIVVKGIGGHGAYPNTTKDPGVLASQIVMGLQTIVSRETSPLEAAVVTVGRIEGGTKRNIIGKEVTLQLTVRSNTDEVRAHTLSAIERIATNMGRAAGLEDDMLPTVTILDESAPATYNDPLLTETAAELMANVLGEQNVIFVDPVMGAEDFSHYGRTDPRIPSLIFWLGAVGEETMAKAAAGEAELPSLHSPFFAPDAEPTIETGVKAMTANAMGLLKK
jgi:hippurate hydrolase